MTTTPLVTVTPPTKRRSRRPQAADAPPPSIAPGPAARTFGIIALVVATLYFLVPVFWLVVASTKNNTDLTSTFGFWFAEPNLAANYDSLMGWTQGLFWRWVGNSLFYSLSAGIIGTLFAVMAGYAIAKFAFPGKKLAVGIIMAGLLLPVALLTVPLYIEFQALGLTNTVWAIIIPSAVSPFGVFLGMVYAQSSVPTELLEAARIDGAGPIREFFSITLPSLKGQVAVALTLTVTGALRAFDLVWVTTQGGPGSSTTTPALLLYRKAFLNPDVGMAAAIGIILAIVCLVVAVVITRLSEEKNA